MAQEKQPIIVGNWKMYKTIEEALAFFDELIPQVEQVTCAVKIAVPFTAIHPSKNKVCNTHIQIGAQNINEAQEGAFTGEVAAIMVKNAGADFALVGHSERRRYFGETNIQINKKIQRAVEIDLPIILCIGETFEDRQAGNTEAILQDQITECLHGIAQQKVHLLTIAYEPIWAIGSGTAATPEVAEGAHLDCRRVMEALFGADGAHVPILYGGSVTPDNGATFLHMPDIDGLLVGNASLKSNAFAKICTSCTIEGI